MKSFMGDCTNAVIEQPGAPSHRAPAGDIDLVQMARWSQNYLAHNPTPDADWQCRFSWWGLQLPVFDPWPYCTDHRPVPDIGHIDPVVPGDTDSRMSYAYVLMREMAGTSDEVALAEQQVERQVERYVAADGLSHVVSAAFTVIDEDNPQPWAVPWATAYELWRRAELYRLTGETRHREQCRTLLAGLSSLASWDTGRAYYAGGSKAWRRGQWANSSWLGSVYPSILEPIVRYWEVAGDAAAMGFARAFADGMLASLQPGLGKGTIQPDGSYYVHHHGHLHAIGGVAHLGAITKEPRYIEWSRKVYEFIRAQGTDYGWFPEADETSERDAVHARHTEICLVADMVHVAVWLAEAGYPEYFDHAERYVRNLLRQAQFHYTPEYEALYRRVHRERPPDEVDAQLAIMRRIEGGFVASPTPNDLVDEDLQHHGTAGDPPLLLDMMGCCPPSGMQALHTVWRHVVTDRADGVYVNMSLACDHAEASVRTWLPERGQLAVAAHGTKDLYLRPPSWAPRQQVALYRRGARVEPVWRGDYVRVSGPEQGEEIVMTYPLVAFDQTAHPRAGANAKDYTISWRGNTVTGIEPGGKYLPLFRK